ncbi:MAG: bifunctional protein-disulfide isomerase/oxidoreductase DsbC [Pseudomonadota bacterium]
MRFLQCNGMLKQVWAILLCGLWATSALAAEPVAVEQKIRAELQAKLPKLSVESVRPSVLPGLYEVTFDTNIIYVDADARYVLSGDLFDLENRQSLTEMRTTALRADLLAQLDEKDMVVFAGKEPKHTVTIFTDISCGYCRKLHSEIQDYLDAGIRVRYLAYPRAGVDSEAGKTAESVWCAADRNQAMTAAKKGEEVAEKSCDNPIAAHFALGQQFGIRGTPALVLEDGRVLPGYVPAERLQQMLEQNKQGG